MDKEETIKKSIGYRAADFIQDGMIVGLGTGSTAKYFIEKLAQRIHQEDLHIQAVASSKRSLEQALSLKIPMIDINSICHVDITIDGADEIDKEKRMIKGGGGALVREKIVASMSREMIVIVDESKISPLLGRKKLPVEVIPFGHTATLHKIKKLGHSATIRMNPESNTVYITDNGNYIIDIFFSHLLLNPEQEEKNLLQIPGVVDTGFFFHLAGRVIIGFSDGQITILP